MSRIWILACWAWVTPVVGAETIRVAVAKGPSLEVAGEGLRVRASPEDPWADLGSTRLESVGPFVSNGDLLAPRLEIDTQAARGLSVGGIPLLGMAEILATDTQLLVVDEVDLEDYVASVVGGEMPSSWPAAALEAQAIAARTYVLKKKLATKEGALFHVEATVLHQVYRGRASLDPRTRAAALATRGQVVTFEGALADTFFFATCRGRTESAASAFGKAAPYLVPVSCEGGETSPLAQWTRRVPLSIASEKFEGAGRIGGDLRDIDVAKRTATGRVATARLQTSHGGRTLSGADLRRLLGYDVMPSLDVRIDRVGRELVLRGEGSGHGVGLCQWCARGRAARGDAASEILAHFYPGTSLAQIY